MLALCAHFLTYVLLFQWIAIGVVAQGNVICTDSGSDWYTNFVGETPCKTYERLRQICNSHYQVGILNPNTPPDVCNEQVADCCCNSVAFALSMLCLTCQQGIGNAGNGIDAGTTAYQLYLSAGRTGFCSPNTNQSLPGNIQAAVCNNNIRIGNVLYNLFWDNGAWFYTYTREAFTLDANALGNASFSRCNSTSSTSMGADKSTVQIAPPKGASTPSPDSASTLTSGSTPTAFPGSSSTTMSSSALTASGSVTNSSSRSASPAPDSSGSVSILSSSSTSPSPSNASSVRSSSQRMGNGAMAGIIVGGILLLAAIVVIVWLLLRRHKLRTVQQRPLVDEFPRDGDRTRYLPVPTNAKLTASSVVPYTSTAPTEYTMPSESLCGGNQDTSANELPTLMTVASDALNKRSITSPPQHGGSLNDPRGFVNFTGAFGGHAERQGSGNERQRSSSGPEKNITETPGPENRRASVTMSAGGFTDAPPAYS